MVVHVHPASAEAVDWDHYNEEHLAKHAVWAEEAQEVLMNSPTWISNVQRQSGDWKAVGETDAGRRLTLVVSVDAIRRRVRPFTGWESTVHERWKR